MHQIQIQDLLREFENLISIENSVKSIMSHDAKKPAFCLCENKEADQLCSNCTADQRLCFRYSDSTIPLLPKSTFSNF